jgi:hypothetical protein
MTWLYNSSNGVLIRDGAQVGIGYSGHGAGLNNVHLEAMPDTGPIPRGAYNIGPFFDDPGGKGPVVSRLTPLPGTDTFGRGGFEIHGDTAADVEHGTSLASHGCIVLARPIREAIRDSGDADLDVV